MANPTGQLFYDPLPAPLNNGAVIPNGFYNFYVSGTTTPAPVYQDPGLTTPYPTQTFNGTPGLYIVTLSGQGQANAPIYLNPTTIYRVQLYTAAGALLEDVNAWVPSFPVVGIGPITLNAQGEMTINQPLQGGVGVTLTLTPVAGGKSLQLNGSAAGNAAIIINTAVTIGTQTATFTATNKPGTGTTSPSKWLPIQCDGGTYYIPLWQ
jgi:hypothetical protein